MPWQAIIPLIQAGINMASNAQANNTNYNLSKEQFQRQEEFAHNEAILADQRQRAQYNDLYSVQAQADQIRKAGMSLSTLYGQGGIGGSANGNMANSPNQTPIPMQPSNIQGLSNDIMQAELIDSQKKNIDADTTLKLSQSDLNTQKIVTEQQLQRVYEKQVSNIEANTALTNEQKENAIATRRQINESINNIMADTFNKKLTGEQIQAQTEYLKATKAYTEAQTTTENLLRAGKLKEIIAHIKEMNATARKLGADANLIEKTTNLQIKQLEINILRDTFAYENIDPNTAEKLALDCINTELGNKILNGQAIEKEEFIKYAKELGWDKYYDHNRKMDIWHNVNESVGTLGQFYRDLGVGTAAFKGNTSGLKKVVMTLIKKTLK